MPRFKENDKIWYIDENNGDILVGFIRPWLGTSGKEVIYDDGELTLSHSKNGHAILLVYPKDIVLAKSVDAKKKINKIRKRYLKEILPHAVKEKKRTVDALDNIRKELAKLKG